MRFIAVVVCAFWGGMACWAVEFDASRPNLILIFTDDQRHDAVGYTGNAAIHTPNLDRLARAGCRFSNCFVNTSICAVSRANLLAGQYPSRHGIVNFFKTFTSRQLEQTVPARLQKAGYQTAFFGKWGIGDSAEKTHQGSTVFDYWAGQPKQTNYFHEADCRYVNVSGFGRPLDDLCDCPADARGKAGIAVRIGKANLVDPVHVDAQVTPQHVRRFLDGRDPAKPFCLMLFFKSPHGPFGDWDPAVEHVTDQHNMPIPAAATLANAQREPEIVKQSLGWPAGQRLLNNSERHDRSIRDYYRSISSMDLGVGRIMDELKQRKLDQNTVVLFTSDNGHFSGEHGLVGKWLMYEPSLRVPGFIYDPRQPSGTVANQLVTTVDFSATLLTLAGLDIPETMSGRDLRPVLGNPDTPWRNDFYYDHPYGHGGKIPRTVGVRSPRYTYTRYIDPDPPFEQLFDLTNDPDQLTNLANNPEAKERLQQLRRRCDQLAHEVGPLNVTGSPVGVHEGITSLNLTTNIAETWVATDALGRKLGDPKEVGGSRQGKYVAMFYWNWHTGHFIDVEPVNVERVFTRHPEAINEYSHPIWTRGGRHHWSEPLFGYYVSTDRWVLRKHAEMLADAGVDVVFFDCTNRTFMWDDALHALGEVWSQARCDGVRAPALAFMCPFNPLGNSRILITKIYEEVYKEGLYRDLWFYWEGKPLLMGYPDNLSPEVQNFFTFRPGQPDYRRGPKRPNHWGWLEIFPQHGYVELAPGKFEQMTVGVAQNATDTLSPAAMNDPSQVYGRSYTQRGGMDTAPDAVNRGLNFQEQWERALAVDPKLIFVTGWNEWTAGRYKVWQGTTNALPDQCNQEYSRDIEPMKGGHGDNYYYQLVNNIRRFKGVARPASCSTAMTAVIDGVFDEWQGVTPVYRDHRNDVEPRDHRGYGRTWYKNDSGRNDFIRAKVGRDSHAWYFYVETAKAISAATDKWMMLLIDIDGDKCTGWEGYDYVVNRLKPHDNQAVLEQSRGGWQWRPCGTIAFQTSGSRLELKIPKALLKADKDTDSLEFKWSDNMQQDGKSMDFYIHGDVAPSGRFNYRYS